MTVRSASSSRSVAGGGASAGVFGETGQSQNSAKLTRENLDTLPKGNSSEAIIRWVVGVHSGSELVAEDAARRAKAVGTLAARVGALSPSVGTLREAIDAVEIEEVKELEAEIFAAIQESAEILAERAKIVASGAAVAFGGVTAFAAAVAAEEEPDTQVEAVVEIAQMFAEDAVKEVEAAAEVAAVAAAAVRGAQTKEEADAEIDSMVKTVAEAERSARVIQRAYDKCKLIIEKTQEE